ncbi:MAG TPA: hypothetical protein EYH01_09155 [Campylobacterales bacterium]|nr:hypothetical protein [Campylobacterales bacterium]HIP60580.1 hypothetical protein [Campylobacterales bacterium]
MNVKQRLKLLAVLSIVAILSLTLANVYKEYLYISKLKKVEDLVSFSRQVSIVMDQIQTERSLSAVYLQSRGRFLVDELDAQRKRTNEEISNFYTISKAYQLLDKSDVLQKDIEAITLLLQGILTARNKIDVFIAKEEMYEYFDSVNRDSLHIISVNAERAPSTDISKDLNAYYFFLKAKEIASKQKAILSASFVSENFTQEILEQTIALIAKEQSYLDVFESLAPQELIDIYKKEENSEVFKDSYDLSQSVISDTKEGSFDLESWFGIIAKKGDIFKEIDKKAIDKIAEDVKQTPTIALYSVLAGVVYLFLILFVIRGINREISRRVHTFDWIV